MSTPYTPKVGDKVREPQWTDGDHATVTGIGDATFLCRPSWNLTIEIAKPFGPHWTYELWVEPKPTVAQRLAKAIYATGGHAEDHKPRVLAASLGLDPASTDRIVVLPYPQEGRQQWIVETEQATLKTWAVYVSDAQTMVAARGGSGPHEFPVVISVVPAP